ncbi:hypothetical protein WA026_000242 [Henosepilachna vigintioctopunctata]|uniref:Cytochrome b5 heme-binding domain-containing protein n=1 Tax=Henosepilachna vigintioctopunctata TaxID=420089 RepID=A0AAW1V6K7_9CUCU
MAPRDEGTEIVSSIGMKYHTNRERFLPSAADWLEGKRKDDNIEGLWRIHNGLYDLDSFIKNHPGGPDWLIITKGTDITEAFETHHIKGVSEQLLSKFYVKSATTPRRSPLKFNENGFYRTLKKRIAEELPKIPKFVVQRSKLFADITVAFYILFCVLSTFSESYLLGALTGYVLALNINISHNFIHMKNNFRMYYLDLSMLSSRDFRVVHALSHHLFPNTIHDLEISMFEPVFFLLPQKKTQLRKYLSWIYALIFFPFIAIRAYTLNLIIQRRIRINTLIPWIALATTYWLTGQPFFTCLKIFIWIILWGSFCFYLIGKTAAHHHPDIFHDGDDARSKDDLDFGAHQLDAVGDRPNINESPFLTLTNFGDHALHHLFPTIDHGMLPYLYPTFLKTCIEFGIEWKLFSSVELVKGALQQLVREKTNKSLPPPLKKISTNSHNST